MIDAFMRWLGYVREDAHAHEWTQWTCVRAIHYLAQGYEHPVKRETLFVRRCTDCGLTQTMHVDGDVVEFCQPQPLKVPDSM